MSVDLGPGPEEVRHEELMEVLRDILTTLRDLAAEQRYMRKESREDSMWTRQEIRESRR